MHDSRSDVNPGRKRAKPSSARHNAEKLMKPNSNRRMPVKMAAKFLCPRDWNRCPMERIARQRRKRGLVHQATIRFDGHRASLAVRVQSQLSQISWSD